MLALCPMLHPTYYAKNYAGIMGAGLHRSNKKEFKEFAKTAGFRSAGHNCQIQKLLYFAYTYISCDCLLLFTCS